MGLLLPSLGWLCAGSGSIAQHWICRRILFDLSRGTVTVQNAERLLLLRIPRDGQAFREDKVGVKRTNDGTSECWSNE